MTRGESSAGAWPPRPRGRPHGAAGVRLWGRWGRPFVLACHFLYTVLKERERRGWCDDDVDRGRLRTKKTLHTAQLPSHTTRAAQARSSGGHANTHTRARLPLSFSLLPCCLLGPLPTHPPPPHPPPLTRPTPPLPTPSHPIPFIPLHMSYTRTARHERRHARTHTQPAHTQPSPHTGR